MKKLVNILLAFVLILAPSLIKTDTLDKNKPQPEKIVTVGYSVKNQKKLFEDKSLEEIDEILQKICEDLIENENPEFEDKLKTLQNNGLIVSVVNK